MKGNNMNEETATGCIGFFVAVAFLVGITAPFFVKFQSIGSGRHTGFVTAVDKRGYIFQNYEVYFKTDNSSSQEDMYCVHRDNEELANKLIQASKNRQPVTVRYEGVRGIGLGLCHATEIKAIE